MKGVKKAIAILGLITFVVCLFALAGTAYAWFSKTFTSEGNTLRAVWEIQNPKFTTVFPNTDKYLYRVGNGNTVKLGSLFKLIDDETSVTGQVKIRIEAVDDESSVCGTTSTGLESGSSANCAYTPNSDWTESTLKFTGEGPVKVTIYDDDSSQYTLHLEVIDAYNVTTYSELVNRNSVLLDDIVMSDNSSFYLSNSALYGNGFTFDVTRGKNTGDTSSTNYLLCISNAVLNNITVKGAEYDTYGSLAGDDHNNAAVLSLGNSTVANSLIMNCAAPIRALDGELLVVNSTLSGGSFANLDVHNCDVTLENVTTINQSDTNGTFGLGIVIYSESVTNAGINVIGELHQYNYLKRSDADKLKDQFSKMLFTYVFDESQYDVYKNTIDGETYINSGIISMTALSDTVSINIPESLGYVGQPVSITFMGTHEGYVYSIPSPVPMSVPEYETEGQYQILPVVVEDLSNESFAGENVLITFLEGDSYEWNADRITATYFDNSLNVGIEVSGDDCTYDPNTKIITFTQTGEYLVKYTFVVEKNYKLDNGEIVTYQVTYTKQRGITVIVTGRPPTVEYVGYSTKLYEIGDKEYLVVADDAASSLDLPHITNNFKINKIYENINGVPTEIKYPVINTDGSTGSTVYFYIFNNFIKITDGETVFDLNSRTKPDNLNVIWGQFSGDSNRDGTQNVGTTATGPDSYLTIFNYSRGNSAAVQIGSYNNKAAYSISVGGARRGDYFFVVKYCYESAGYKFYYYVGYTSTPIRTVAFEGNGGTVGTKGISVKSGNSLTLPSAAYEGNTFCGWFTSQTGGSNVGNAGAKYTPAENNVVLYAHWEPNYTVTYDANGGTVTPLSATYSGTPLTLPLPINDELTFVGWYDDPFAGNLIGDAGQTFIPQQDITLYAHYSSDYKVAYNANGGECSEAFSLSDGSKPVILPTATRTGYDLSGWYTSANGGTKIGDPGVSYLPASSITLFAQWAPRSYKINITSNNSTTTVTVNGTTVNNGGSVAYDSVVKVVLSYSANNSQTFTINQGNTSVTYYSNQACTSETTSTAAGTYYFKMPAGDVTISSSSTATWCLTSDTLITLADGTQKRVDELTTDDTLLVWNLQTGSYDVAPIVFNDSDPYGEYTVMHVCFSDGTDVGAVYEHGFFDLDLGKYVYVNAETMDDYIGHSFVKIGNMEENTWAVVTMTEVWTENISTAVYSPVTFSHLCYYADGMLSMPGGIEGLFNIFDVDTEYMIYDAETMQEDVAMYDFFTLEDFDGMISEEAFEAFNGAWLKVSIGKGLITWEEIEILAERYMPLIGGNP